MDLATAFENTKKEDKKRKRCPVPWSWFKRAIDNYCLGHPEPPRLTTTIYASDIGNICPREWVLQYWMPYDQYTSLEKKLYVDVGTLIHDIFQEFLGNMGVLKGDWVLPDGDVVENEYLPEEGAKFEEQRVFDPYYRFSGKVDGIINVELLKYLSKQNGIWQDLMLNMPELDEEEYLWELKTTNKSNYQNIKGPEDIPYNNRIQATIYQVLLSRPSTLFTYLERDSLNVKTVLYEGEKALWNEAVQLATTIWESVKNRVLPDPRNPVEDDPWEDTDFDKYIEENVRPNPKRDKINLNEVVGKVHA